MTTPRKNFYIRLQPHKESELEEVANWLNGKTSYEKNQLVAQALVMCYLFLARLDSGMNEKALYAAGFNCCNQAENHFDRISRSLPSQLQTKTIVDLPILEDPPSDLPAPISQKELALSQTRSMPVKTKNIPLDDVDGLFG